MSATRSVVAPRAFCATRAAASRGVRAGAGATPRACARSRKNFNFGFASRSRGVALSAADGEDAEADPDAVAPEDYALVVELLDSETGEELKEKVDLIAKNGLLTKGVVDAARVVVEQNEAAGQEADILDLLRSVYDVLLLKFKETYAPAAKAALEFGSKLMDLFTAEDLEAMEAGETPVSIGKVKLMMQEEFDKEGEDHVDKMAFAKYLDEVLPVMSLQDERLREKMAVADTEQAQKLVVVMMNRTKERLKVEALRDIATEL